jgi:GR25 family glycosyltransferase involved in LPS biosynthesis
MAESLLPKLFMVFTLRRVLNIAMLWRIMMIMIIYSNSHCYTWYFLSKAKQLEVAALGANIFYYLLESNAITFYRPSKALGHLSLRISATKVNNLRILMYVD